MNGREERMWARLSEAAEQDGSCSMTRIETATHTGVADVEYVALPWHGWIELKASHVVRDNSRCTLESPYTFAQLGWLLTHHNPPSHLRSWLCVAFTGPRTWREWWLLTPSASVALLAVRKAPLVSGMRQRPGVVVCATPGEVLSTLYSQARELTRPLTRRRKEK